MTKKCISPSFCNTPTFFLYFPFPARRTEESRQERRGEKNKGRKNRRGGWKKRNFNKQDYPLPLLYSLLYKVDIVSQKYHFSHYKLYICWAQSMDLRNPWIALCKAWIHALHRRSMDRALFAQSWDCASCAYAVILDHVTFST